MRKRASARRWRRQDEPGKPSDYVTHFDELPSDRTHAVIHLRVSTDNQKDHLLRYEEFLRGLVEAKGHHLLSVTHEVAGGEVSDRSWRWRHQLIRSMQIARKHPNGYVLACSMCRIIRHADMTKHNQGILPLVEDFECLADWAGDVPLATAWHPDLDPYEVKSRQAKLFDNGKGGRPKKKQPGDTKRRTLLHQSKAFWLHGAAGFSFGELAELFKVKKTQAARWWEQRKKRRR